MTDIAHHVAHLAQAHSRLDAHEGRLTKLETHTAVAAERAEHFQRSLDKIDNGVTWITRLIIGSIIAAVIAYLVKGGFNVV